MSDIKITKIETALPQHVMPGLLALRIHTDAGYIGNGETYYVPHAVAAMIHDWMARRLLGADALAIENHFRFLYERAANFGARGTELRAISAIDLALWDIFGQATEQPIWQLLGGRTRQSIPVYNSSGGPAYGGRGDRRPNDYGWPGHGIVGNEGPLNDYWSVVNRPVDYAKELLDEGIRGLKVWTLDFAAHKEGGPLHISHRDLDEGLRPLRAIREALGSDIELALDGHGFFQLAAAMRIARTVRDLDMLWLEDIIRPDGVDTLADLRHQTDVPLAVSEMLVGYEDFRLVLEKRAADYVMIDPTWVGGISQTRRVAELAQFYNVPVVMHDCTGPFTLLAGIHVATAASNVAWQETFRAHIRILYPQLIRESIEVVDGQAQPPAAPGIGASWLPELFERSDANVARVKHLKRCVIQKPGFSLRIGPVSGNQKPGFSIRRQSMGTTRSSFRIAVGAIAHETHSFATPQTDLEDFRNLALFSGTDLVTSQSGSRSAAAGMINNARDNWMLVPTLYAGAMPGGVVTTAAFDFILGELKDRLIAALPLDGVLLALHGAMVSEDDLDAESTILASVREIVGPRTAIVVTLDMHGNISPRSVALADVLIAFDKNPHTDPYERGWEAADILDRLLKGEIKATTGYAHPRLMLAPQATGTDDLPLSAVHARAAEMEAEEAVICVSVFGGFAYSDTPDAGVSLVVSTDDDPALAQRHADELAAILMANRHAALPDFLAPDDAVSAALRMPGRPIILVDSADNIGGGTPGDGTDALRAMLAADVQEGAVIIADPEAVALCWEAGEGASVTLDVGGKVDRWHGEPVRVNGLVRCLSDGTFEAELANNHFASFFGNTIHMGRTVWLRAGGVNIVLTERKIPPFDLAQLRFLGMIPEEQKMIAVKSAVAYRAAYMPIAAGVVEMDTAGLCSANLDRFPYRHVRRPILPLDDLAELDQA